MILLGGWRSTLGLGMSLLLASACSSAANQDPAVLAWLGTDGMHWQTLQAKPTTLDAASNAAAEQKLAAQYQQVALGSVWKLFVFVYLQQNAVKEAPFSCSKLGAKRDDEEYCCEPGQSVGREMALARSCGPYFSASRLQIQPAAWQAYWRQTLPTARLAEMPWLLNLPQLRPETKVAPASLLAAMASLPPAASQAARSALLASSLQGTAQAGLAQLGSAPRLKTFTWPHPQKKGMRLGGGAGWLPNGNVFWFAGTGSSKNVLQQWAGPLAQQLQSIGRQPDTRLSASLAEEPCVDVAFFKRYPVKKIQLLKIGNEVGNQAGKAASELRQSGRLQGTYQISFANGNTLRMQASGQIQAERSTAGAWKISGRFALNDYVARVLDREGDAQYPAAAQALAIAARSYLLQNGEVHGGCYNIADDSRRQRVSPNPASNAALQASWFTDGLILQGVDVRFHQDQAKENVLAWQQAVQQAQAGWQFQQILAHAYPRAALAGLFGSADCQRMPASEQWLEKMHLRWQRQLQAEVGFERLSSVPLVCALDYGNPYSDQRRMRIYVRPQFGHEERLSLAHEYLHLSFRYHPRGVDEAYIEQMARKLVDGEFAQSLPASH